MEWEEYAAELAARETHARRRSHTNMLHSLGELLYFPKVPGLSNGYFPPGFLT